MKTEQEYTKDLAEIRSMMERSTKFLSLTGLSGVMAGLYALAGVYIAHQWLSFQPEAVTSDDSGYLFSGNNLDLIFLALVILILAVGTAVFLSHRKSERDGEKLWNSAARRLAINMAIPLFTGGIFILILFSKGLLSLAAPLSLIFYGLALLNASKFTFEELKYLGIINIVLGLIAAYFVEFGLLLWALGFGIMHIIYGVYMHVRYEK